jgi:hypothetical protein
MELMESESSARHGVNGSGNLEAQYPVPGAIGKEQRLKK